MGTSLEDRAVEFASHWHAPERCQGCIRAETRV